MVVAAGSCQAVWNLIQKILVARSTAAYSITEPAAHAAANRTADQNTATRPAHCGGENYNSAMASIKKTVSNDGQMEGYRRNSRSFKFP